MKLKFWTTKIIYCLFCWDKKKWARILVLPYLRTFLFKIFLKAVFGHRDQLNWTGIGFAKITFFSLVCTFRPFCFYSFWYVSCTRYFLLRYWEDSCIAFSVKFFLIRQLFQQEVKRWIVSHSEYFLSMSVSSSSSFCSNLRM